MNQSGKVSFYVWTIMGYVICPLTGYFTLPVDKTTVPFTSLRWQPALQQVWQLAL